MRSETNGSVTGGDPVTLVDPKDARSGPSSNRRPVCRPIRQEPDASGALDRVPPGWRGTSATAKLQAGPVDWRSGQERNRGNR